MTNEIKLKPCPFCGKEPEIEVCSLSKEGWLTRQNMVRLVIKCSCCHYTFQTKDVGDCEWHNLEYVKNKMINRWNKRYTDNG